METSLLLNFQGVGTKLLKCGETYVLTPLLMGVCEEMIEYITDDAYNRQGGFIELSGRFTVGERKMIGKKSKVEPTNG